MAANEGLLPAASRGAGLHPALAHTTPLRPPRQQPAAELLEFLLYGEVPSRLGL
jgi:hypothetical protein